MTKAQDALNKANEKLADAKKAAEDNATAIANAQKKLDDAKDALSKAQASASDANTKYESATSAANTAQNAVNSAQSALSSATDRQQKAAEAVTAAQQALDAAKAAAGTDFADTDAGKSAQQAVDAANAELATAQAQKDEAQKQLDSANATLAAAQDALKKLQESSGTKVTYEQNSRGFFEWMGNETAAKLLTDSKYTGTDSVTGKTFLSYTDLSDPEDATSIKNLKRALNYIDECNKLREANGKGDLKVDLILMAKGEINANWSYVDTENRTNNHASRNGEHAYYEYYSDILYKTETQNIGSGENICGYGYDDPDKNPYEPFKYWYDDEKETGGGHYSNIIYTGYETTGFGCNTTGNAHDMYVAAQEFSAMIYGATDDERVTYTTSELRAKLDTFLAMFSGTGSDALTKAQQAVTDAQNAVTSATDALSAASANVTAKQQAVTAAQDAYDAAKQSHQSDMAAKVARAQKALDSANSAKSQADSDVTSAQDKLTDAKTALAARNSELASAKQAKAAADADVASKQAAVDAATKELESIEGGTAVADAQKGVDAAQAALDAAKQAASDAADALSKARQSASDAQKAYDDALSKLSDANAAASMARQAADDANAKLQAAEKAYSDLKGRADARDAAAKALADAQKALDEAKADLDAAKDAVPGLEEQAKQYGDVAEMLAALPSPSEYLADPQKLLDVRDKLVEYGTGEGLTDATKDALTRYRKLLTDAYRLAMEAKGLGPVVEEDQNAADVADANLETARANYDLEQKIAEQLRQAEAARQQRATQKQSNAAQVASTTKWAPKHMADASAVPQTGDAQSPYLPLGAAGVVAALAGVGLRRRREE